MVAPSMARVEKSSAHTLYEAAAGACTTSTQGAIEESATACDSKLYAKKVVAHHVQSYEKLNHTLPMVLPLHIKKFPRRNSKGIPHKRPETPIYHSQPDPESILHAPAPQRRETMVRFESPSPSVQEDDAVIVSRDLGEGYDAMILERGGRLERVVTNTRLGIPSMDMMAKLSRELLSVSNALTGTYTPDDLPSRESTPTDLPPRYTTPDPTISSLPRTPSNLGSSDFPVTVTTEPTLPSHILRAQDFTVMSPRLSARQSPLFFTESSMPSLTASPRPSTTTTILGSELTDSPSRIPRLVATSPTQAAHARANSQTIRHVMRMEKDRALQEAATAERRVRRARTFQNDVRRALA